MLKRKRHTLKDQQKTEEHFRQIERNGREFVLPYLVAIYRGTKDKPEQVATGFLLRCKSRRVFLTAKHSLYGEHGDVDPMTNMIFVNGKLKFINELKSHRLKVDPDNDLVALYCRGVSTEASLSSRKLMPNSRSLCACDHTWIFGARFQTRSHRTSSRPIRLHQQSPRSWARVCRLTAPKKPKSRYREQN